MSNPFTEHNYGSGGGMIATISGVKPSESVQMKVLTYPEGFPSAGAPTLAAALDDEQDVRSVQGGGEAAESMASLAPNTARDLPPIDEGIRAWTFLAAAFVVELLCFSGVFSFSIFQDFLVQSSESPLRQATNVQASAIGTLLVSFSYFAPPVCQQVWARFARWNRWMGFITLQVGGASLIIASFTRSFTLLLLFMGLIPGIALGLGVMNYFIWLPQWFFKRRGLANGIVFAGAGTGGMIFPFLFTVTLRHVGFAWTLRIWAALIMLGGGAASFFVRPRLPLTSGPMSSTAQQDHSTSNNNTIERWRGKLSFMATPLWMMQAASTFVASMSFFSVSFYLAVYCVSLGLTQNASTGVVCAFNGAVLVGEILVGHICDRRPYAGVIGCIGILGALSAFLLFGFAQSLIGAIFFVLIYGLAAGSYVSVWPAAAYDIARLKNMQTANVIFSFVFVRGIASAVGPLVAAALYNPQKNELRQIFGSFGFQDLILFVGSCMLVLFFGSPLTARVRETTFRSGNAAELQERL